MRIKLFSLILLLFVFFSCLYVVSAESSIDDVNTVGSNGVDDVTTVSADSNVDISKSVNAVDEEDNISSDSSFLDDNSLNAVNNNGVDDVLNVSAADKGNDVLSADYQNSFSALKEIIDAAPAGSTVNLTVNYKYDPVYDTSLIDGVTINKALFIDGKAHSIDGNKVARIFYVTSANVAFHNVTFSNAYRQYSPNDTSQFKIHGGALFFTTATNIRFTWCKFNLIEIYRSSYNSVGSGIYAKSVNHFDVLNCTFTGSNAYLCYQGGAIFFEGSHIMIKDSNFTNVRTTNEGGSLFFQGTRSNITVENCRFTGTNTEPDSIVYVANGADVLINNNYFNCQAYNGIVEVATARNNVNITWNNFTNCYTSYEGPIFLGTGRHANVLISHNRLTNGNYGYRPFMLRSGAGSGTITVEWNYFNGVNSRSESGMITIWDSNYARVNVYNNTFVNCRSQTFGGCIRTTSVTYVQDNNFTNCYLHGNGNTIYSRGVGVYATNYAYIDNNNFIGNYYSAIPLIAEGIIYISPTGTGVITNNNFTNNRIRQSHSSHTGIIHNEGNNTIIANNSLKDSNCSDASGGIIYNLGNNVTIFNINISNVVAGTGGSIYNGGNNVNISKVNVALSSADTGGAFYILGDTVNITDCNFSKCHADNYGVIYCGAPNSRLYNDNYLDNYAVTQGVLAIESNVQVIKQNFTRNNVTNGYAGTILIIGNDNYLNDINISKTSALEGGAIYIAGDYNNLSNIGIVETSATSTHGGAVYSSGSYFNINNLTVSKSNASLDGGAVYNTGVNSNINNASFTNVHSGRNGGVIFWSGNNGNISSITIKDAYAENNGGAIYWSGINGTMANLVVNNAHATIGGVVYCVSPDTKILGGNFNNIRAIGDGGAIFWTGSNANLTGIIFNNVSSGANGGAIYGTATDTSFNNLKFNDINATENGGVIYWAGARSHLYDINVTNVNSFTGSGGAIYWSGDKSSIRKARFENVSSDINGALYWTGFESYLDNVTFIKCIAKDQGGAIYWTGSSSNLTNGVFINNSASNGGAVFWNAVNGNLTNIKFSFNNVSADGGAVYLIGDSPFMYNLTFINNTAGFKGGAINLVGMDPIFSLLNCINNSAGVDGGAVIIDGSNTDLSNSNFANNSAMTSGGAVYVSGVDATITNVNFTLNDAGIGGALYCAGDSCTVSFADFTRNNATTGGALYMGGLRDGLVFNSTFRDNNASGSGGTIYWTSSSGTFVNSSVIGSYAREGGAIYWTGDGANLNSLKFDEVSATENGGILYLSASNINVSNSDFLNSNASSGGAIYWLGADGVLSNANFVNNSAILNGGAIYWMGNNANLTHANFTNNSAGVDGGALYIVSYGASLNTVNFNNNAAANYGGGIYWGGNGNIHNAEFRLNKAYSGSAIYNSGILDLSSAVVLDNKANISSFDINYVQSSNAVTIYTVLYGFDNFLNGIWTTSDNIRVNKITYWGIDGVMVSDPVWIRPVEGVSESQLYFDSRLANIPVNVAYKHVTGEGDTVTFSGNTSIYGEYNITSSKSVMGVGNFNFTASHSDDNYYFGYGDSVIIGVGVIDPIVRISLAESEVYYDGNVTIMVSVTTLDDKLTPILGVNGLVDVYIDDEFFNTFNITDNSLSQTVHLPVKYGVGMHNISCYFYNGTDRQGHEIGHNNSNVYYFNIVKNYLPGIVNISTVNSTYYVDDLFNITLTGPDSYVGPIYYVAGIFNDTVVLDNGSCNITVSYPVDGPVNVFIYVRGDDNYLPSSSSYSINIIKHDLNITILNTTGYSLGNINVGDDAVFMVNLSVNDTVKDIIISVDDVNYTFAVNNSLCMVNISGLDAGVHTVSARYSGDNKYNSANTNNYVLTVNKVDIANISVVPVDSSIFVGDDAVFDIIVNSTNSSLYPVNDVVSITIAGKSYNISITNNSGRLIISGLAEGVYDVMVVYSGSDQFNPSSVSVVGAIEVSKVNTNVTVSSPASISVGENVTFDISVNSALSRYVVNGVATIKINNHEYDVLIKNGKGNITISGLKYSPDVYDVGVVYGGDYQFVNSSTSTTVSVIRKDIVSMNLVVNNTIYVGQDAILNITMNSDVPVNSFVTVNVDNREFTVPINNGTGYLIISGLKYKASPYEISVSYDGDDMHNSYATKKTQIRVLKVDIRNISVKPVLSPIFVGDDAVFNINMTSSISDYVVNGFVTVNVEGRMFNVSINDNVGRFSVSNLSNGTYRVFVSYAGDDTFNPFNNYSTVNASSINVVKIPTSISMNDVTLNVGDVAVIVARINNSAVTGSVSFVVDGKEIVSSIVKGVATCEVYGLNTSANKTITAKYSGDNKFLNSSTTANLIISKITDSASVSVYNIFVGESENVVIVLPSDISNGTVTVKFNGTVLSTSDYTIRGNVITFNRTVDAVGRYAVDVIVADDAKYNTITASKSFLVSKVSDYNIFATASSIVLGDNSTVRVVLPADATDGGVVIDGKSYSVSEATSGVVIPGVSNAGSYAVSVAYVNSSKYVDKTTIANYNVFKAPSNVSIAISDVVLADEDISFVVTATNSTGKITVIINDNEYYPLNNTLFTIPAGLVYGNYTVIVKLNGDNNYEPSQVSKNIEVVKNVVSITVEDIASPVKVDDRVVITANFDKFISGDVVFDIGGVNHTVKVNNANQVNYTFIPKVNGTYDVTVSYLGNDKYNLSTSSVVKSFVVDKIPTYLIVKSDPIFVGQDAIISVEVRDNRATGNVIVTVNGKSYVASLVNGKGDVIVSGLNNNTNNNVVAVYVGDNKYDSSTNTSNVVVNKVDIAFIGISTDKPMYYVDENAVLTFNMMPSVEAYKVNGVLSVRIADNDYNVSITNNTGNLIVYHLKYGVNVVNVSYAGDDTFNSMIRDYAASIIVNKISVDIGVNPKEQIIFVGDDAVLTINISSTVENHYVNGFAIVNVAGIRYNVSIINGTGHLTVYNLANGKYDVDVFYEGDSVFNFNNVIGAASIIVNKKPTSVTMNDVTLNVGNAAVIIARINDTTVTGNVSFTVDNKKYVTGIVNGVATLTVYGLNTSANKTITAVYSGDDKFLNSSTTANLIINKVSDTAIINVYNISAGESENVVIVLPSDVTNGTITVKFDNTVLKPQDYSINNNVIVFERVIHISDNYTVEVSVVDDAKYNNISASAEFEVSKTMNYDVLVDVDEVILGENSTVKVTLPSDATNGVVTINGEDYTVDQAKKGIKLPKADTAGVHTVDVSYVDSKYANKTVTVEYNVLKATSAVSIDIGDVFYVGENIKFTVNTVNSTGIIHVFINGVEYNPSNASEYTINGGLANATYNVVVNLDADANYESSGTSKVIYIIKKPVSIVLDDIVSPVNVDDNVVIKAKFNDTVTGNVIFEINGVNFTVAVNGNEVSYTYTPKVNGTYVVKAYYGGDDKFNANTTKLSKSFTVNKIPTQLIITANPTYVAQDAIIAVEVRNNEATGNVVITVNGRNYTVSLVDGKGSIIVRGLTNDTDNNIYAVYMGDNKYTSSSNSSNIVINKVDVTSITIDPSSQNILVGQNATFTINLTSLFSAYLLYGWVNVSIAGNSYIVPILSNSGILTVPGLSAGTYSVHVDYAGDPTFGSMNQTFDNAITVSKVPVSINVFPSIQDIYVGQYASFDVSVVANEPGYVVNGFVTVNVNDDSFNVSITNGSGRFRVYNLEYGVHTVNVSYAGDDTYLAAANVAEADVRVNKVLVTIDVNPITQSIFVGDNAVLKITILPTVENYTVNGSALVTVDGVGDFNVSITNGVGYVTFYDLVNATHIVHVYYAGDNVFNSKTFDETVHVLVNKRPTSISMPDVSLNVGDVAVITATVNYTDVTGNITFIVNNKEYTVGIINGVARVNVTNLNTSANKTITAKYSGDYKYINSSTTAILNISKVPGNANIIVHNITAGETETVFINLPSDTSNGTITVRFNNEIVNDYIINNNIISFNRTLQSFGNYTVSVNVDDDCKYYDFANSTVFTVFKVAPENYTISIDVNNTHVFENIPIIINLPNDANGTLSLSVDNVTINAVIPVVGGVATYTLDNLSSGNHTISVTYGNDKYDTKTVSTNVFVAKIASSINVTAPEDAKVAHDIIIHVVPEAKSTGNVTATINGKPYIVEGRTIINASDLLEGNYTVVVTLAEDDNFLESTNHTVFVVTRNDVSLVLNDVVGEIRVDYPVVLHVNLTANVTGSVVFHINDVNYTVNITESDFAEYIWIPTNDGLINAYASYLGSDIYYPNSSNVIELDVFKNPISFTNISVHNIMVDDIEHVIISLNESDATGIVIININGTEYDSSVVNGSVAFDISGLAAGTYNVIAFYGGDFKYLATNAISGEFNVSKYDAPMFITAEDIMVLDDATVIVNVPDNAGGHISITVNGESVYLPVVDGTVSWTVSNLSAGTYEVNAVYSGDYKYLSNSSVGNFTVYRYNSTLDIVYEDAGWTDENVNVSVKLSDDATGNVTLSINGTDYVLPVNNGHVDFSIPMLGAGDYGAVVSYSGDYKYSDASDTFNFTINSNYPIIVSANVVKYYAGSERLYVTLTNVRGDKLAGETLYITINGITYSRVTNADGNCSVPINLPSGEFGVSIIYNTSELYDPIEYIVNVTVLSTVVGEDLVKVFCNDSQYWARFTDSEGNPLVGTAVTFNINGVFYTRTTNDDGWAKLNINLPAGEYIITGYNPVTGEAHSNLIKVLPRIVENHDLVKRYRNASQYVVRIIGDDALPVGAGVSVEFNINGVFYTRNTDADGYAKLNINLPEGEYIITAYHKGCTVSNNIIVLPN